MPTFEWVPSQNGFVVAPPQRHSAIVSCSERNSLPSASTTTGSFTRYGPSRAAIFACSAIVIHVFMTDGLLVHRAHERAQVDVGILKLCAVDRALSFDQPHRAAQVLSSVDSHGREDPPILSIERHEVSLLHAAPHDEF